MKNKNIFDFLTIIIGVIAALSALILLIHALIITQLYKTIFVVGFSGLTFLLCKYIKTLISDIRNDKH